MKQNFINSFLRSYMVVLLIPVLVLLLGAVGEIHVVRGEIKRSNQQKAEHSVELIENSIDVMEMLVTQCARASSTMKAASREKVDNNSIFLYKDAVDMLSQIISFQNIDLIKDICIYFDKVDYVAYDATFYRMSLFESYRESWGLTQEEWKQMTDTKVLQMQYVRGGEGNLYLIMPVNMRPAGGNEGMVVACIDTGELLKYFAFAEEYGECALYITDASGRLLFYEDAYVNRSQQMIERQEYGGGSNTIQVTAGNGWKYYVLLPDNVEAGRLVILCVAVGIMGILVVFAGMGLSMYQARKFGMPLEKMFTMVENDVNHERNAERLGEIVTGIVKSNRELMEEMEENRPLLRKAFFHDLITLDVTSTKELKYLAENAGIHLENGRFRVACVRLFANNDSYDVDEQTLEAVKVILRSMQIHLEEITAGEVWFYQRDYLSQLVIFAGKNQEQIWDCMEDTWGWLRRVFATESVWGVSSACTDVLNIWKYCEEAETAREHCNVRQHITEYRTEFEDKKQFYFPEVAQEKLTNGLKSSDNLAVKNLLEILERENFINRKLSRNSFIRLNSKITNLLILFEQKNGELNDFIMKLNSIVVDQGENAQREWMDTLYNVCQRICRRIKNEKNQQRSSLIEEIKGYILEHYPEPGLGLATISMEFRISEGYVSTLFKEHTDINFAEYVEKIRLNKACEMLREKKYTIETISTAVGYNSVHSFRRAFKRVYGISPREYEGQGK